MTELDVNLSLDAKDYQEYLALLRSMQDPILWNPKDQVPKHHLLAKLSGVYLFSQFGNSLVRTGSRTVEFGEVEGLFEHAQGVAHALSSGFSIAKLAMTIVDFIRIPLTYMVAWQLGQNPELSLSKKAKWLYSGILMGLAITAFAIPVTAVPIAIATAVLGLGSSIFSLGKFLYAKHQCKKELHQVKEQLAEKEKDAEKLRVKATHLEEQLLEAIQKKDKKAIDDLGTDIKQIAAMYHNCTMEMQGLKEKQHSLEQQLERKGAGALLDKTLSFGLASLGLIGITLSLFFPPAGLGLLLGAVAAGLIYGVVRVTAPLVSRLFNFVRSKFSSAAEKTDASTIEEHPQAQQENILIHESTVDVIKELSEHVPSPRPFVENLQIEEVETEKILAHESPIVKPSSLDAYLTASSPESINLAESEQESEGDEEGEGDNVKLH